MTETLVHMLHAEHSKPQTMRIINWIGYDPERIQALINVFTGQQYRLTQRAAWPLGDIGVKHPELMAPHWPALIGQLSQQQVHVAVKRNIVRILQFAEIPEELLGEVADICFRFVEDPKEAVAVRAFSLRVLGNICKQEPELWPEVKLLIDEHLPHTTAAFKSVAKSILKNS